MNKQQYKDYKKAVDKNLKGITHISTGLCSNCPECMRILGFTDEKAFDDAISNGEVCDEGNFSNSSCDACGSKLGGDRYAAHGRMQPEDTLVHLDVCPDCLYYLNYDCLDDTTMANMEN